jgi:hypothetical protein
MHDLGMIAKLHNWIGPLSVNGLTVTLLSYCE